MSTMSLHSVPSRICIFLVSLLGILFLPSGALGQFGPQIQGPETYVSWSVRPIPSGIGVQDTSVVKLTATIADGWKMYALDASLPSMEDVLARPNGVTVSVADTLAGLTWLGEVGQSPPSAGYDEIFEMDLKWFYGAASFYTAVASSDSVAGTLRVPVTVRYQICNDAMGVCLRPETTGLSTALSVDPSCIDCSATGQDIALTQPALAEREDLDASTGGYCRSFSWPSGQDWLRY